MLLLNRLLAHHALWVAVLLLPLLLATAGFGLALLAELTVTLAAVAMPLLALLALLLLAVAARSAQV